MTCAIVKWSYSESLIWSVESKSETLENFEKQFAILWHCMFREVSLLLHLSICLYLQRKLSSMVYAFICVKRTRHGEYFFFSLAVPEFGVDFVGFSHRLTAFLNGFETHNGNAMWAHFWAIPNAVETLTNALPNACSHSVRSLAYLKNEFRPARANMK